MRMLMCCHQSVGMMMGGWMMGMVVIAQRWMMVVSVWIGGAQSRGGRVMMAPMDICSRQVGCCGVLMGMVGVVVVISKVGTV